MVIIANKRFKRFANRLAQSFADNSHPTSLALVTPLLLREKKEFVFLFFTFFAACSREGGPAQRIPGESKYTAGNYRGLSLLKPLLNRRTKMHYVTLNCHLTKGISAP